MNKVYTIGRDPSCDIVVPDCTDVVSRVHASLKVKGKGKYTLIDQSRNGVYVNGIKMSTNEEIPVTRKDVISFAHVWELNWNDVPKEKSSGMMWILAIIAAAVVGSILYFIFKPQPQHRPVAPAVTEDSVPTPQTPDTVVVRDSTARETIVVVQERVVPPRPPRERPQNSDEETPQEEPEVINPLL